MSIKKTMTEQQAQHILEILKQDKSHKSGHYHYGYIHLSYDRDKQLFVKKHEDLSVNIYDPTLTYEYLTEDEMIAYLVRYYRYDEVIEYFETYYHIKF